MRVGGREREREKQRSNNKLNSITEGPSRGPDVLHSHVLLSL